MFIGLPALPIPAPQIYQGLPALGSEDGSLSETGQPSVKKLFFPISGLADFVFQYCPADSQGAFCRKRSLSLRHPFFRLGSSSCVPPACARTTPSLVPWPPPLNRVFFSLPVPIGVTVYPRAPLRLLAPGTGGDCGHGPPFSILPIRQPDCFYLQHVRVPRPFHPGDGVLFSARP